MGGVELLMYNYFNEIPDTTRLYRSNLFRSGKSLFTSLNPDLYGSQSDRQAVLDLGDPEAKKGNLLWVLNSIP